MLGAQGRDGGVCFPCRDSYRVVFKRPVEFKRTFETEARRSSDFCTVDAKGDLAWRDLLEAHDKVVRSELSHFRGKEVKSLGDGFLATFDGPARAIHCASAIRDSLHRLDLPVRIGVHTGEVELAEDDVRGIAVHIPSRVAHIGGADDVLVSRTVKDLVAGSGIKFEDFGVHALKGIPEAWQVFRALG
jgi:class 3 adenylate cyclase